MELLLDPTLWIAFAMLTTLEIVLGIDNIIFLTILVGRLPAAQRDAARRAGLAFAMVTRIALLLSLSWVMGLTTELFTVAGQSLSGRDLVLLGGGLFLLYKASREIFDAVEQGGEGALATEQGTSQGGEGFGLGGGPGRLARTHCGLVHHPADQGRDHHEDDERKQVLHLVDRERVQRWDEVVVSNRLAPTAAASAG